MDEQLEKRNKLAADVLRLSRNTLVVNLRFLDAALSRLEPMATEEISLATDGRTLAYDPRHILRQYKADRAVCVRDYLHVVLHCVFRHMFVHTLVDHAAWDLACDIAVEHTITGLGLKAASASREARQQAEFQRLEQAVGQLTAEKLYRHFLDQNRSGAELADLRGLFYADDHRLWYMTEEEKTAPGLGSSRVSVGADAPGGPQSQSDSGATVAVLGSEADWQSVSERMQMDMETFSKSQGKDPAAMLQNLREINRERYDYSEFLRRFAVMGEVMQVNDDEFDYIFYTYGLHLYDNMPLVEPLEYKEVKRVKEFVVAIDTSGSVAGDTVQRFVQKTWNILKTTESFFTKINLHIIQCDATIQEDAKITTQEAFDNYIETMQIHGLGGTDFRPVFSYVDWLQEKKEFTNLKGLIYFTDGFGTFPEQMPDYETAFVFLDEELNNYDVPPWAMKLVLQKDEI